MITSSTVHLSREAKRGLFATFKVKVCARFLRLVLSVLVAAQLNSSDFIPLSYVVFLRIVSGPPDGFCSISGPPVRKRGGEYVLLPQGLRCCSVLLAGAREGGFAHVSNSPSEALLSVTRWPVIQCVYSAIIKELFAILLFFFFQTVMTLHTKTTKSNQPPVDIELGYFLQAALQSAYLCLLQRGWFYKLHNTNTQTSTHCLFCLTSSLLPLPNFIYICI